MASIHIQNQTRKAAIAEATQQIEAFRSYLHSPKFAGHDPRDGTPNCYINTAEVLARLEQIKTALDPDELY